MEVTGDRNRMVLAAMIFFISLLLSNRLNAQQTFHLSGSVFSIGNSVQESKQKVKSLKIYKSNKAEMICSHDTTRTIHYALLKRNYIGSNRKNIN
jgi:hypothetical protein